MADLKDTYFVVKKPDGKFFRGVHGNRANALFETRRGAESFLNRETRSARHGMNSFAGYLSQEIERKAPQVEVDRTQNTYDTYRRRFEELCTYEVVEVRLVEV